MGGDFGMDVTVPACVLALTLYPDLTLILVGKESGLKHALSSCPKHLKARLQIFHASEEVAMDEPPAMALRTKKDSSMRQAINLVHEGKAMACISAGNTGALMATARFVLKTLPGIDRPAIMSYLPTEIEGKKLMMLDLGANVDCSEEHLYQFAMMGSIAAQLINDIDSPKVALLNNGSEVIKGNEQVRAASARLSEDTELNYIGYIEGDHLFKGKADVVVCDGFVGNIALKTVEGTAKLVSHYLKTAFMQNTMTQLLAWFAKPVLRFFKGHVDPRHYNGASFLGLQGVVVKSHGNADRAAFLNAIKIAVKQAKQQVPERIKQQIQHHLQD